MSESLEWTEAEELEWVEDLIPEGCMAVAATRATLYIDADGIICSSLSWTGDYTQLIGLAERLKHHILLELENEDEDDD